MYIHIHFLCSSQWQETNKFLSYLNCAMDDTNNVFGGVFWKENTIQFCVKLLSELYH